MGEPVKTVEIPIREIRQIKIGQVEDPTAGTGCTVLVCEDGMRAGLDIRGGGPASRETALLDPLTAAQTIHAVVQRFRPRRRQRRDGISGGTGHRL